MVANNRSLYAHRYNHPPWKRYYFTDISTNNSQVVYSFYFDVLFVNRVWLQVVAKGDWFLDKCSGDGFEPEIECVCDCAYGQCCLEYP